MGDDAVERAGLGDLLGDLDGDARGARRDLIADLLGQGFDADRIRAAAAAQRLVLLPLDRVLEADGDRTLEDIAAQHGVDPVDLVLTRRALGLTAFADTPVYGAALEDHAERLREATANGVPVDALIALNRIIGRAMASVASGSRDVITAVLGSDPAASERDIARRTAGAVEALSPIMEGVLAYAFRAHAAELVRHEQVDGAGAGIADAEEAREIGVAFADLVGFTSLGDEMPPGELAVVAGRLEALTAEVVGPPVALIKTIGDEVMLVSTDVPALDGAVRALLRAADDEPAPFPRLRAGAAAGLALRRAGDWYGAPVNLASRLTAHAEPGTLVADAAFRDAARDGADWTELGARPVRGLRADVAVFRAPARP